MKPETMMQYMLKEITIQKLSQYLQESTVAEHMLSSPFTAGFWNIRAILRNLLREFPFYPTLEYVEIAKKNPKCKKASGDSLWTDMMQMLNNKGFIYDDPWTNNQYSCHYDVIHIVLTIDKILF